MISPRPKSKVCCGISKRVLPSISGRQPRVMAMAYIFEDLFDSYDQQHKKEFPMPCSSSFFLMMCQPPVPFQDKLPLLLFFSFPCSYKLYHSIPSLEILSIILFLFSLYLKLLQILHSHVRVQRQDPQIRNNMWGLYFWAWVTSLAIIKIS